MGKFGAIDNLCVNTIRTLSIDMIQKANSGHPGLPLGAAVPHLPADHAAGARRAGALGGEARRGLGRADGGESLEGHR